jgi:sugar/nucleoside kinase (ribokinase family)
VVEGEAAHVTDDAVLGRVAGTSAVKWDGRWRSDGHLSHARHGARGVISTAGAGDALAAAFTHVYAATGDPHAAIEQAVVFAGHAVGAEP